MRSFVFLAAILFVCTPGSGLTQTSTPGSLATTVEPQMGLSCVNVRGRWRLCGDAKPFKKLTIGVGIWFYEVDPSGQLTAVGTAHTDCVSLGADPKVPRDIRQIAAEQCPDGWQRPQRIRQ